MTYICKDERPI